MSKTFRYLVFILILVAACSPKSNNPLSHGYHDLTAHFNAYFIAEERMNEIENMIYGGYDWNYNKVLPIYAQVDSTDTAGIKTQVEDCIEKASIAIQRHPGSKWEDNSYLLVGKARYYYLEYPDAVETFKYVNKFGKDDDTRHAALIELLKTFVDAGEFNNAIAVSDFLKKEELNRKNLKELNLCRAYLYQKRKDMDQMVQNLVKAEELMSSGKEKARIEFIIGQVYQQLGEDDEAYRYYENVLKYSPGYELSFYTKLNLAQVTPLTSPADSKRIAKYFRKLLKDPKNLEYKDKIYYEMASFELKQGNLEEAIEFYKLSASNSINNPRQKAYSFLKLGQIYYDSIRNFELAQMYYDSTVNTMPPDEEGFEKIRQRKEILDDFVLQLNTIRKNDSLIAISELPRDSIVALAKVVIAEEKARQERLAKEQKRQERLRTAFDQGNADLIGASLKPGAIWYFYSPSAVGRGTQEFRRVWGTRILEDNWRRSNKTEATVAGEGEEEVQDEQITDTETLADNAEGGSEDSEIESMMEEIPFDDASKQALLKEVEKALFLLGGIYHFKLAETENAILTFEQLIQRFPASEYEAEVLYQLYLLYKDKAPNLSEARAQKLKKLYPDSIYTKLVDNPNYREESQAATEQLVKVYNKAYRLYNTGQFEKAKRMIDSALVIYPENDFSDNLHLLGVLCIGVIDGQYKYQYELNNFIKVYEKSELVPYAQKLVKASEDYQINLVNSSKPKFVEYFDQKHYLVIIYPAKAELIQEVPKEVETYLKENNFALSTGSLVLDENNGMVLINDFPGKGSADKFLKTLKNDLDLSDLHKGEKFYYFVITEDNFDIFYKSKDLNAYLNFFEKHYPQ